MRARLLRLLLPGASGVVFQNELRDLLRDRRAVFFAFVMPFFLYPLLFFGLTGLPKVREGRLSQRELVVAVAGPWRGLEPYLAEKKLIPTESFPSTHALREGKASLYVQVRLPRTPGAGPSPDRRIQIRVFHLGTSQESQEARRRFDTALKEYECQFLRRRFASRGAAVDPGKSTIEQTIDLSSDDEKNRVKLALMLPAVIVLLLITGGSFAALDLLAGEKERRTLETLYLHPVTVNSVVWAKFSVVLLISLVSVVLQFFGMMLSFYAARKLGLGVLVGSSLPHELPSVGTLAGVFACTVPLAVLTGAGLLLISGYSRSFREAQTYLLPATLLALVGVMLALAPQVRLNSIVAVVPLANLTLAIREVLTGDATWFPMVVAFVSGSCYAWLLLRKLTSLMNREEVVLGLEAPVRVGAADREGRARRALVVGVGMLFLAYFLGGWLQSLHVHWGLAATLWCVVLPAALLCCRIFRLPLKNALALHGNWRSCVPVLFLAPSAALLMVMYGQLQETFLPLPQDFQRAAQEVFQGEGLSLPVALFLFVISPAICEELFWRGFFQGELECRDRPVKNIILVGLFFGLFHLSIHRLVPTAAVGVLLAYLRYRAGSILPCILFHGLYNGLLVFWVGRWMEGESAALLGDPLLVSSAAVILVLALACVRGVNNASECSVR